MNMDAASSSSTDVDVLPQQHKYDVFLSFRGPDTRLKFTSHLYAALKRKNILTYMDDKSLERGDKIGPALLTAIEQSKMSIIIFSEQYASSTWCLDELVNILRCEEAYGQLVVPVFYDIDPSDVRWQQRSYADSFLTLEEIFKDDLNKVQTWRDVLTRAANLSGFDSQSNNISRNENEFVENIVKYVLLKLNRKSSVSTEGLVGMESNIRQLESLLRIHAQDVSYRAVGIWGMGGCGKTTLANVVFQRNSSEFQVCAFMANVRERSEKQGLYQLRNELLRKLLNEEHLIIDAPSIGSSFITDRLSRTRVLAVFDDVSDLTQLEFLLDQIQFGPRSRIIITTRNKRLLKKRVQEKHIYKMNLLSENKALELFQSIAIEDDGSQEDYLDLSLKVVRYTGCNPLALKVLGFSFLHCTSKKMWEQELKKLGTSPNDKVKNALRLCYDGLEDNEKGIFLDIACFLNGENRYDAERLLEMHGFSPLPGLAVLIDMSLISIKSDRIEMHDLLQEMGKAIESGDEEVGKRKRLWNATDFYQILNNNSGTSVVEAMYLDMSKIQELHMNPEVFKKMHNLKLLKLYAPREVHEDCKRQKISILKRKHPSWLPHLPMVKAFQSLLAKSRIWDPLRSMLGSYEKVSDYDYEVFQKYCKLYFPRGLESFPEELRYLYWEGYPFKSLPSKYFPENLVEIHMPYSQVKQLWSNGQSLRSLKHLTLSNSEQLTEVPDLTGSPYIERIDLSWCTSLVEVPTYFQNLVNLTHLYLNYCKSLKILRGVPCNIESLCMSWSGIEQLPSSLLSCEKLHTLDLAVCPYLRNLDSSKLDVYGGDRRLLPESTELQKRPSSMSSVVGRLISLSSLDLAYSRLSEIPDSLISLSTLIYLNLSGTMIEGIPTSIMNVSRLVILRLSGCKKLQSLPELPSLLQCLDVSECTSLMSVASSRVSKLQPWGQYKGATGYPWWQWFNFTGCWELDESSRNNILDNAQLRIIRMASLKQGRSSTVICPGSEIPKWMGYKREGCEINIKHPHHELDTAMEEEYPHCLGFAISVVLARRVVFPRTDYPGFELACDFNCKTNDDSEGYQRKFYGMFWGNFEEDHVVMFFNEDTCLDMKLKKKKKKLGSDLIPYWNPANKLTEASVRLYPIKLDTRGDEEVEEAGIEVKRCGFQWLYNDTI